MTENLFEVLQGEFSQLGWFVRATDDADAMALSLPFDTEVGVKWAVALLRRYDDRVVAGAFSYESLGRNALEGVSRLEFTSDANAAEQINSLTVSVTGAVRATYACALLHGRPERLHAEKSTVLDLVDLNGKPAKSWVFVEKSTQMAIYETFHKSVAEKVNAEKYEAVPAGKYLASLNRRLKEERMAAGDSHQGRQISERAR